MKLTNTFAVNTPIDRAWAVLTDLEGIAPCLPGAQLTGVDGDVYSGKVKIKVGPVISEFAGTARFLERDASAYRGVIDAKGRDLSIIRNQADGPVSLFTYATREAFVGVYHPHTSSGTEPPAN